MTARRSPLDARHKQLGGRFVDFGGWEMPVQYQSVLAEHRAVRHDVGWFDVSHLGRFRWQGEGATEAMRALLCNDIWRIEPGRTQYTMLLNSDGGVIDDIVVWRWENESYFVLPNAANHHRVMKAFAAAAPEVEMTDLREETVMIAVQGPQAPALLEQILAVSPQRHRTASTNFAGETVWMAGTGYTGERGGEIVARPSAGEVLVTALTEAGATPCGLGARDTLRLEAGLALWGQDLDETTSPLEAGLDFVVSFDHRFVGREALLKQRQHGLAKKLVAFALADRQIPRHGYALRAGQSRGEVTSGNFSPGLERGIGLGYLGPPNLDDPLEVEVRGRWVAADRQQLPFVGR
jgi:aminomethyltransferase